MKRLLICAVLLLPTGCVSNLDKQALLLNEKYRTVVRLFADTSDIAREQWLSNANELMRFARDAVREKWKADVLAFHDKDGDLMMDDGTGKAVPWKRAELETALFAPKDSLESNLASLWSKQADLDRTNENWKQAIATVRKTTDVYEITDAHVAEAKASLEAAAAAATNFAAGAIGVGMGALLAK